MPKTGIARDDRYKNHNPGDFHPESPRRLESIYAMLDTPHMQGRFAEVPIIRAERELLLLNHAPGYVDLVAETEGGPPRQLDPDTVTSPGSYEAALLAVGGLCQAIDLVVSGQLENAFALVRPPGHHAERARAAGFCLFNNVAIGARHAQEAHGLKRILIVDWDLHHGNGTQHSFEEDSSILYFSTHQYPYYPGTGAFQEAGRGAGAGFTVNVPLSVGYGDGDFVEILRWILQPVAREFAPDLVLISAGFDTFAGDPLGGMQVTPTGYAAQTRILLDIAAECCGGKAVFTLEGGYHLEGLRDSVQAVLLEMSGATRSNPEELARQADANRLRTLVERVNQIHGQFWKSLGA